MDAVIFGRAQAATRSAEQWKAYAENLERQLRISQANAAGMEALKDAAIKELARVDPRSYLLVQQNRQRIFDSGFEPVASGKRAA
ncbi:hypothetical protein [Paraburkholderia hospita]|uniref:hypothetical protein n=1 Tax=Paraburkholderia hospita TaxID=169430 RepID=UPI0008A78A42|nr:hypothetical protein [Paraburkholderia hospita]SEI14414.1 hypothetical protein SAMN05192544_102524 [Paraburkholderia hospita]